MKDKRFVASINTCKLKIEITQTGTYAGFCCNNLKW